MSKDRQDDEEFFDAVSELESDDIDIGNIDIKPMEILTSYLQKPFQSIMKQIGDNLTDIQTRHFMQIADGVTQYEEVLGNEAKEAMLEETRVTREQEQARIAQEQKDVAMTNRLELLQKTKTELLEAAMIPVNWYKFIKEAPKKANDILDKADQKATITLNLWESINSKLEWIVTKFNAFAKATKDFVNYLPSTIKKSSKSAVKSILDNLKSVEKFFSKTKASHIELPESPRVDSSPRSNQDVSPPQTPATSGKSKDSWAKLFNNQKLRKGPTSATLSVGNLPHIGDGSAFGGGGESVKRKSHAPRKVRINLDLPSLKEKDKPRSSSWVARSKSETLKTPKSR